MNAMVSTLTRPEGRVLRTLERENRQLKKRFQPSPGPKAGCYHRQVAVAVQHIKVSTLTRPEGRVLRTLERENRQLKKRFQPSPGPKAGCYVPIR